MIASGDNSMSILPVIGQTYSFCPIMAELTQTGGPTLSAGIVSVDQHTGVISIDSSDKTLHGITVTYVLKMAPAMIVGAAPSEFIVTFTFYDECYDAEISEAIPSNLSNWPLFLATTVPFTPASSSKNCGVITYSLTKLSDGLAPQVEIQSLDSSVYVYADDPVSHVGQHYYRIKACIQVFNNGAMFTCDSCCSDSNPFEVNIYDPCNDAVIETQTIVGSLSA